MSSSSTLSGFVRPDHALLLVDRRATPTRRASCDPLLQQQDGAARAGPPSGMSATSGASISVGFSVPSMKPVRSRSCRYGQLEVSSATVASARSSAIARSRHVEDDVVGAAREPEHGVVLGRRHHEAVDAGEVVVEARDAVRRVVRRDLAPELGPEPGDEVDAAHRRPRLAQRRRPPRRDRRPRRAERVELEVGVRRRAEREDPALGSSHGSMVCARGTTTLGYRDPQPSQR